MNNTDSLSVLKMELTQQLVPQIVDLLLASLTEGRAVHEVEESLWDLTLRIGRRSLSAFFDAHGTGDLGATVTLPDGQDVQRLEELHARRYVSIFGPFELKRTVYGSREGQALDFVPLDNRLQLPHSFRDPDYEPGPRPQPCHKRVWASLPHDGPEPRTSIAVVFDWVWWEFAQRNPRLKRPTVCLCDGQEALWQACTDAVLDDDRIEILDLLHVTPRLWAAAKLLYGQKSKQVLPFVRQRVTQVLEGKVETVIRTLRRLGQGLPGAKKNALGRICSYLNKNRRRMHYDEYLRQGYPIASGVIEGACRHLIKDRMERAGMHWTLTGAQAMLDLRSVWISGQWAAFQQQRIEHETGHLYPHRNLVAGEAFFALAA